MTFKSFNHLLIGYKWSTRVNGKLLQKDTSEDHEHNISFSQINLSEARENFFKKITNSQINLSEARENFFKNNKAHRAKKDISEALEQIHVPKNLSEA